jgi:hypothetical protein
MSVKVASSRFIHSSLEVWAALYQQLISISDFHRLGKWLVAECEKAQLLRQTEKLKESSLILSGIPIQEYQLIGQFYQGFTRMSQNPRKVFEDVVEKSKTYKSKALIALASLELKDNDYDLGIKYCGEAICRSHNISTIIHAARNIAVIKSAEGFHGSALKDLEAIAPLVRYATPVARYQYLNSYAVELGEAGRIEEAQNVCQITLASPFAFAYPEWRETGQDLALRGYKSRSSVRVTQTIPGNLLYLPEREASDTSIQTNPGSTPVVSLEDWKKKMVKDNGEDKNIDEMSDKDIFMEILHLSSQQTITRKELQQILDAIKKITSKKD